VTGKIEIDTDVLPEDLEADVDRFRGIIQAGVCPYCGDLLARQTTRDGWIYAVPCGHRLGRAELETENDFGWGEPSYE